MALEYGTVNGNMRRTADPRTGGPRYSLRTVKEYSEKVEYIHRNPVRAGLVQRPEDWLWSSVREYSGSPQEEATRHATLPIDRFLLPSDEQARI